MTKLEKISITCMPGPFDLKCPICGNTIWEKMQDMNEWWKCTNCAIEMRVQIHPKYHCVRLELQGA